MLACHDMRNIELICNCGQKIEAPENIVGQGCACPTCNASIMVPKIVFQGRGAKAWTIVRWIILGIGLVGILWWDYDYWKSDHSFMPNEMLLVVTFPTALWIAIAIGLFVHPKHKGRPVAVFGCGIMAVGWCALRSIPYVLCGLLVFLSGLTMLILRAIKESKTA